jgi:hypothetical protein
VALDGVRHLVRGFDQEPSAAGLFADSGGEIGLMMDRRLS